MNIADLRPLKVYLFTFSFSNFIFSPVKPEVEEYDLAGLDETWQESQLEEKSAQESDKSESEEDSDSDVIPQLDGPADEKPKGMRFSNETKLFIFLPVTSRSETGALVFLKSESAAAL